MISKDAIDNLNRTADNLKKQGLLARSIGILKASVPIKIESVNHHAVSQMISRGITEEQAQSYIDDSLVMFEQNSGEKRLYISKDGNSLILVDGKRLLTAYSSDSFDEGMKRIAQEVKAYE